MTGPEAMEGPAVDVSDAASIRKDVARCVEQVSAFDDRLRGIENHVAWARRILHRVELDRPGVPAARAGVDAARLLELLDEIVVALTGRIYADASYEDAEAIEAELNQLLDRVRDSADCG